MRQLHNDLIGGGLALAFAQLVLSCWCAPTCAVLLRLANYEVCCAPARLVPVSRNTSGR